MSTGGCTSSQADTPSPGQTPHPWQSNTPPRAGRHPLGRHAPRTQADGYCSGRYASYWNACLCLSISEIFHIHKIIRSFLTNSKLIVIARKRSFGRGNIFTSVCQEFCSQRGSALGGCLVLGGSGPGGVVPGGDPPMATAAGGTHPTGMHSC